MSAQLYTGYGRFYDMTTQQLSYSA